MPAPQEVIKLIENFERNLDAYRSGKYNETQVRRDFIKLKGTLPFKYLIKLKGQCSN